MHAAQALSALLAALDKVEARYAIGGSVASSIHGIPRFTRDVDILVMIDAKQLDEFVGLLSREFVADRAYVDQMFRLGRHANVIHIETAFKIDLFQAQTEWTRHEIANSEWQVTGMFGEPMELPVVSAADIILAKLDWYKRGGGPSQWKDMHCVLAVKGVHLDRQYLCHWAAKLGVADLLEKLLDEAGEWANN